MSEMERMKERFRSKQAAGLVDIKFFVAGDSVSAEDIAASANRMDALVDEGKCRRHTSWPKPEQREIAHLLA